MRYSLFKSTILGFCCGLFSLGIPQCQKIGQEDLVEIPDEAFLMALIGTGVDKDEDGRISLEEAQATVTLKVPSSNIYDLSGLEAFLNLDSLDVSMNSLSEVDISENIRLRFLECRGCELTSLDITGNPELRYLDCSGDLALDNYLKRLDVTNNPELEILNCAGNEISMLDVSNNQSLKTLICGRNKLSSLEVAGNTNLTKLLCNNNLLTNLDVTANSELTNMITCGNQFTKLDLSQNRGLTKIGIDNMPTLTQVCVWTIPFPPPGVVILSDFSPNIIYTLNCNL